ncbi:hypothetical protein PCYB_074320 [Plasmodium cynomolgi strain B]|uniref:Uncharacterized protein n=1 Tax=Plasmodium cynomolgi (strain B) TaxID=1120755 RepID=K6UD39_PLACD|nr:hypothetical protein PCYB_074320 [Plasmodium cynomolgi strain B]GAB65931.1 hypothetical protein PCYB_074320 [Plasmodium cynomolgi strain B]
MSLSQLISLGNNSAALLKNIIGSKLGSLFKPSPNHEYLFPSILSYSGFLILVCTAYKLYEKCYEGNEDKLEFAGTAVFDAHSADSDKGQKVLSGQNDMNSEQSAGGSEEHAGEEADEEGNDEEMDEELGEELGEDYGEQYGEPYEGEYGEMLDQRYGEDYGGEYGEEYDEEDGEEYSEENGEEYNEENSEEYNDEWVYPEDHQGGVQYQLKDEEVLVK